MINSLVNLLISIVFNFYFYKNPINFGFAISYNSAIFIVLLESILDCCKKIRSFI